MPVLTTLGLVIATLAITLGLTATAASLASFVEAPRDRAQEHQLTASAKNDVLEAGQLGAPPARLPALRLPVEGESEPGLSLPHRSGSGPWKSPLYPQNSVTLWDRIRASSGRDRHAFLLGSAIQIHAPAAAATPGPRNALPTCCPQP